MAIREFIHNLTKPKNLVQTQNFIGAESFATKNPYMLQCYDEDQYASIYPSVKAISNEFMKIRPFAIDANGKPKQNVPAINALYHPNQLDSSVTFREKLAVMNLTHRMTYLLVWRREGNETKPGGAITPQNIAGFTFLEYPAITRREGRTYYRIGSQEFNDSEVIVLPGGVDSKSLYTGYAAGEASRRWATLDQYIADFQNGFFENGAVPAGQFVITASTKQDFNDTVDKLQDAHRGAAKNNNVVYTPRPIDPNTGKPADAKIEWIPYQATNKDIGFKELFEQANKRIDSTFGVPASIRGVGEANNYATARVDQQNFIRFTIEPLALRIYTQVTHELNRISGGLGVAVTFTLDYPAVADEEKVQAETKSIEVNTLQVLINAGYTLESAIAALELSTSYKLLELGETATPDIENDKPDVDEGDEVIKSPDPEKIDGVTTLNKVSFDVEVKNEDQDFIDLYDVAESTMQRQVNKAVKELKKEDIQNEVSPEPTQEDEEQFSDEMMAVIAGILLAYGTIQYGKGKELLESVGIDTDTLTEYALTQEAETKYATYLRKVGTGYMGDTAESIRNVLADAKANELTLKQTKDNLRKIMDTDEYRIKRLAETELNRSQSMGSIESMIKIQNQTGVTIEKTLMHTGSDVPCEFCKSLIGRWEKVEQVFVREGETIVGTDGGIMINKFSDNECFDPHPHGHCLPEYRIVS